MRKIVLTVALMITLVIGFQMIISAEEPSNNDTPTADEVIKKIEAQIFYPDEQATLESAEYTLIYGPQILMLQFEQKLSYGNKEKAKGIEKGLFKPESYGKKEAGKKPDAKKDKESAITDTARTWPNYEVTMAFWRLADPANLLMQLFVVPLHRTFPEDKWNRELNEQDDGYELIFTPKSERPISGTDPAILIVNSVTLAIDKSFVVSKVVLGFDQTFMEGVDLPGAGPMRFAEDSNVEVIFIKYKDKLLIQELKQVIHAGSINLTPTYKFEFKEIGGFMLPTIKDISLPGGELSGTMGGMELHFLEEYLDYKIKPKKK